MTGDNPCGATVDPFIAEVARLPTKLLVALNLMRLRNSGEFRYTDSSAELLVAEVARLPMNPLPALNVSRIRNSGEFRYIAWPAPSVIRDAEYSERSAEFTPARISRITADVLVALR